MKPGFKIQLSGRVRSCLRDVNEFGGGDGVKEESVFDKKKIQNHWYGEVFLK